MMRLRFSLCAALLLASLAPTASVAQQSPSSVAAKDHLSYYTYYKTSDGESVAGVAAKFGLAESSLVRMNPYLSQYGNDLPAGTLICVPKDGSRETTGLLARSERLAKAKEEKEKAAAAAVTKTTKNTAKGSSKSTKTAKSTKPVKETEWPSDEEWETLAELATKGAPRPPERASMNIEPPPSKLIRDNGEIVWIPAAKTKPPAPKKTVTADTARGQLNSRKGKAIHSVIVSCRSYMGVPYVWGGEDPSGFDCSGYIQYVFGKHGIHLPRTADIQFNVGQVVKFGDEKPGDLVFFETYYPGPSHVGVYLGRDYFIHASSSRGVTVDRLSSDFFAQRYLGAKRNF